MRLRRRAAAPPLATAVALLAAAAGTLFAQQPPPSPPPTIEEEVEVREVGVLADLPERLRGRSAEELRTALVVLEAGVARAPVGVDALDAGGAYGRVLVLIDRARCDSRITGAALAALGAAAERLTALGPVEVAELGDRLAPVGEPVRSADGAASRLASLARVPCDGTRSAGPTARVEIPDSALSCARRPCLLIWVGPGWAAADEGGSIRPVGSAEVDPLARRLAGEGWTFLAAPVLPADETAPRRNVPEPESRPGSDRHTFGVDVLDRSGARRQPVTEEEYERFVGVEQAPLRRLVGATAGEYADRPAEIEAALARLADRSILWYRTDRPVSGEPPELVVREPAGEGRRLRAAEWAPRSTAAAEGSGD